jgi:hypothetical protein
MSTVIRRRRGTRTNLGPYKRHELLGGRIMYPVQGYSGYGDGRSVNVADYISEEMKADWKANREVLLQIWRGEKSEEEVFHDTLPWLYYTDTETLPWAELHLMD